MYDCYDQPGRKRTKDYLDMMLSHGYLPGTTLPSRVTDHSATLIDHIFIKEHNPSEKTISGNIFTDISDHFANFFLSFKTEIPSKTDRKKICIFGENNTANFVKILQHTN